MYGSYGSYSSMGAMSISAPVDITSNNLLAHDRSCAFPSWPRSDSLSSDSERPTSYLSDDDLLFPDPFEDDARSISSSTSVSSLHISAGVDDEALEVARLEREREAMQREAALRYIVNEKERRRQQALRRQRAMAPRSSSSKKSSKSKLASMSPIGEGSSN